MQDAVGAAHRELRMARVQTYLSILVERRAAKTLAALDAAKAPGTGRMKGTAMTDTFGSWLA